MKELIMISILLSAISIGIVYETKKNVDTIMKRVTPHTKLKTKTN